MRKELDFGHRDVRASDAVAAGEVYWWAPNVVSALYVPVRYVGQVYGRRLVPTCLCQAVVLIDEHTIPNIFHLDVLEGNGGNGPRPALPCLDPQSIVRIPYKCVANRYVRDARAGIVHAQAPYAANHK